MYWVYILQSENGKYYIGQTNNLERRLNQHFSKSVNSTKANEYKLVYKEEFESRHESIMREKQLKSWKSHTAINKLINELG